MERLERALLKAHAGGDKRRMAALYAEAAALRQAAGDEDAAAFLYTQAYVLALDCGDESLAAAVLAHLKASGREW